MAPNQLGILEQGEWEDVQVKSDWKPDWKPAMPTRLRRLSPGRVKSWFWPRSTGCGSQQLRPTAWLDGLRGFAAFLVYWQHHELWAHDYDTENPIFENAFGYNKKFYLVSFPGIRLLFTGGHFAVAIFFVISGYVLSAKPLKLIHDGEFLKLGDNVASALFRRWFRLYLPIICTTLVYCTMWHAFGIWVSNATAKGSWREEVWAWYAEFKNFSFVFNSGGLPWFSYNVHLWSIPLEMKGSIVVYTVALAISRCTRNARLWVMSGLIFYFLYITDAYYCALFVAGMLLGELDLLAKKDELPRFLARLEPAKEFICWHLFAVGIYLAGVPNQNDNLDQLRKNRGWYYLSFLKPQAVFDYKWFYLFWAAIFVITATPRIRWVKPFFETRFCQYLGRISYALYLVHGPVLSTLGERLYMAAGWLEWRAKEYLPGWHNKFPLPRVGPMGLELAFLLPHLVLLPLTFWVAEMVTRFVDEPSVRFPAWLYRKATGAEKQPQLAVKE
ncbi:uncharacterized protein E0L32_010655 [Thyridium curvatum]|uniref:Acyltransferase 3 domain-containing protein n=1 Tax=Thyridium curvatum TaxID=1093900 RepID=A0A507AKU7_9PEZI|nr:uncharacterized protein E0L32_010655 [Thyridium curvatum]TPX07657.1 hypothetical protein E0L32_010655 [Thyridium curvatum]